MFKLPDLPYEYNALEPLISKKTLECHHKKHHATYVNNLNNFSQGTGYEKLSLDDVILKSYQEKKAPVFNNAAQVWNHSFYWECMQGEGPQDISQDFKSLIEKSFGDVEQFKKEFKQAAISQFGSGWAWLTQEQEKLKIIKTGNAELPLTSGYRALLTIDVWEHAYYLDYQNRRIDYIDIFLNHLVNWKFVEKNLES